MYAEIREKEREAMKGEKKINSGEENVYPRIESLLLLPTKVERREEEYAGTRLRRKGQIFRLRVIPKDVSDD